MVDPLLSNHENDGLLDTESKGYRSLLWPPGFDTSTGTAFTKLKPNVWRDLGLAYLVTEWASEVEHRKEVEKILGILCLDEEILCYRLDVLEDLLNNPNLTARMESLFPTMDTLARNVYPDSKDSNTLKEVTWRMGELQCIVDCIQGLAEVIMEVGDSLVSKGLRALMQEILRLQEDKNYQALVRELPKLLSELRACASVTIGVNLDGYLRPVEATLLSVNKERFTSQSMLSRLFGKNIKDLEGIAPLHSVPKRETSGPYALPIHEDLGWAVEPRMVPLFADLADVIEQTTRPVARQLKRYSTITSRLFVSLRQDLIFYLGAVRLINKMREHGLPLCRPTFAPIQERISSVRDFYNLNLALLNARKPVGKNLDEVIVLNEVSIGPEGRVLIITGPNQGGKTTYLQGLGILQVLAQMGVFIPGSDANISPVDNIFTHFPVEEKPEAKHGRFGEEARRLGEIFNEVTCHSLVLLNESLSSTNAGESLYLARDVVGILSRLGVRSLYSTHLHELATHSYENGFDLQVDDGVVSLVSSPVDGEHSSTKDIHRSFKIEKRPPLGRSYAKELAHRYGISYDQLESVLFARGVMGRKSS